MNLHVLSLIALIYGAIMVLSGVFFLSGDTMLGGEDVEGLFYSVVLLCGGLAQVWYAQTTRVRLHLPVYETISTLDNDLLFSAEGKLVYKNSLIMIVLAVLATLLELVLGWLSVNMIQQLPVLLIDEEPVRVGMGVLFLCSLFGAVPSLIYNVRTWNMQRVILND